MPELLAGSSSAPLATPQQIQNNELRSKLPKKISWNRGEGGRRARTAVRCWRTELLPAQTCTASPPCASSTALAPSTPKSQSRLERNPKEELSNSQPRRLSGWDRIRAVLTSQVGGECSPQEGRAEVLGLTPHTTSRALLAPAPPPSSTHSQVIPGRNATFQGEVCF